jgi:uncharacterized protein (DUF169 family)
MTPSRWDKNGWIDVSGKLQLEQQPVAVKYSTSVPEGISQLDGSMRLCEMIRHAHQGNVFYAAPENHFCGAALYTFGVDLPPVYTSGVYGTGLEVFDDPRAGSRLYDHIPRMQARRNINYICFAPLDKADFDPDLLLFATTEDQSEVILRAMSYSTGDMWMSKSTGVIGCAWLFVYPYLSGEVNFTPILSMGMRANNIVPKNRHLISIPFDAMPGLLDSLKRMPVTLTALGPDGDEFRRALLTRMGLDPNH